MAYIDIDGKKIYFEEYGIGKNPTLVYMHGGPGESCLTYTYQAQRLGKYFHVIVLTNMVYFVLMLFRKKQKRM